MTLDTINVQIVEQQKVNVSVNPENKLNVSTPNYIIIESGHHEEYKGLTEVTPKAHNQTILETKNKLVKENIKVKEVPYFETSNDYGNTVFIAKE